MLSFPFWKRKRIQHPTWDYVKGEVLTGGAALFAPAEKTEADPLLLVTGTGYVNRETLNVYQPPQVRAAMLAPPVGLGGVQMGGIYFMPLTNSDYQPLE